MRVYLSLSADRVARAEFQASSRAIVKIYHDDLATMRQAFQREMQESRMQVQQAAALCCGLFNCVLWAVRIAQASPAETRFGSVWCFL